MMITRFARDQGSCVLANEVPSETEIHDIHANPDGGTAGREEIRRKRYDQLPIHSIIH